MTPATLNTILNTAPMIIQGAGKLLKLMRDKDKDISPVRETLPITVDSLKQQVKQMETRLQENYQSDVEQVRLIEQLAKQNESLAETLKQTYRKVTVLTWIMVIAVGISGFAILLLARR